MQQRPFGNTGVTVSAVGIGAMSFSNFYGPVDTEQSHAILAKALDLGIDNIDTANVYGMGTSEDRIGSFLAQQGKQKEGLFKIATKAAITRTPEGKRVFDNSKEHLTAELDKSLKRLGLEQIELFYVHRREADRPIEEVTETLADLVKTGKIKQFGYSEIAPTSLEVAAALHPVGAVQSEYSLATRSPEMGLVQRTAALGATLVAFSPVGRGLLTDTPNSYDQCQELDFLKGNPRFMQPHHARNIAATDGFRALAQEMGTKASTLAIAWVLHQGNHIIAIPGTRSVEHLEELAAGADLKLSDADLATLEKTLPIGWAHGDRYSAAQWVGPERYC